MWCVWGDFMSGLLLVVLPPMLLSIPPPPASAHAPVNLDKRMVQEPDKRQPDVRWVRDAPCRF